MNNWQVNFSKKLLGIGLGIGISLKTFALPIGFGINQHDLIYKELRTKNTIIYHDSRTAHEAAMVANSIEAIKPTLEQWLGIFQNTKIPIITSASTDGASFANFVTDAIELQTMGQGSRDLFWHEYVHTLMYRHLHNFLGPAGSIIHLPWLPAWFIEGLAEALSVSVGSDWQSGIERYQALSQDWPTYDRLHSLYSKSNFFLRGYATSGAFVSWLLREQKHEKFLKNFLKKFYKNTWPQYYFLSFNPFSQFMPMDDALRIYFKNDGKQLYEQYKESAQTFWKENTRRALLSQDKGQRLIFSGVPKLTRTGTQVFSILSSNGKTKRFRFDFASETGWATKIRPTPFVLPDQIASYTSIARTGFHVVVLGERDTKNGIIKETIAHARMNRTTQESEIERLITKPLGSVRDIYESIDKLIWIEEDTEITRLCWLNKSLLKETTELIDRTKVVCPLIFRQPQTLISLGDTRKLYSALGIYPETSHEIALSTDIWLSVKEQTLFGDRTRLLIFHPSTNTTTEASGFDNRLLPQAYAQAKDENWLLVSEHGYRTLWQINNNGQCLGRLELSDMVTDLVGSEDGKLTITLWTGQSYQVRQLPLSVVNEKKPCKPPLAMTSPLIYALQQTAPISLHDAVSGAQTWNVKDYDLSKEIDRSTSIRQVAEPLDKSRLPNGEEAYTADKSQPANWRSRHVLTVPWLGADDALGPQIGFVSIPLMDHMQNETLRLTFLYGSASRYPNTDLTLLSTRFWPTIKISAFRRQLYNGLTRNKQGSVSTSYMDEQGFNSELEWPFYFQKTTFTATAGILSSYRKRFLGPTGILEGHLNEPYLSLSVSTQLEKLNFNLSITGKNAFSAINKTFSYDKLAASASFSYPLLSSRLSLNLDTARTRGPKDKTPILREYFTPQRTFLAGSGGGYNQNSFGLLGEGSLFLPRFGDNKLKGELKWQLPIIKDINKQVWLFYFDELLFSAFVNRGGAWYQGNNMYGRMVTSHGYTTDLLFENKGVRLNIGLGYGQVLNDPFQLYATAGFDALF